MKKTIVAALAAALMSSGAYAADVFGKGSTKDGAGFDGPVAVNWTGLYVGGSVGYGNANHNLSLHDYFKDYCLEKSRADNPEFNRFEDNESYGTPARIWTLDNKNAIFSDYFNSGEPWGSCADVSYNGGTTKPYVTAEGDSREIGHLDGLNTSGIVGDGRIGFDAQRGRFVFGVFGAYSFNNMEADGSLDGVGSFNLEKGEEWSVGGRAGILVNPRTLAYIMAAYTQTDYELTLHGSGDDPSRSRETTFSGVMVGGGIEFAVTNNVFLGIEGTHTFYGKETIFDDYDAERNVGTRLDDELGETKVLGTLKLKLNTGLGGVID